MLNFLDSRLHRSGDDCGYAMLIVIGSVLVMTIFATAALTMLTARQKQSRHDQDWQAVSQAAQAGIDDYIARLRNNPNYFVEGNSDATNAAMSGYAEVPGTTSGATFHYVVDTSNAYSSTNPYIGITSTGDVNGVKRTVAVRLSKLSFLDDMYFTKYEALDPSAGGGGSYSTCSTYYYAGRSSSCTNIYFSDDDTINGPVYSQDEVQLAGSPTFNSAFVTGWQDSRRLYYGCGSGYTCNPHFNGTRPRYGWLDFPSTNSSLLADADPAQGGGGCVFQGPTSITFNAAGTMTIVSPETSASATTGCGTYDWTTAHTVSVPSGEVVYVKGASCTVSLSTIERDIGYPVSGDSNSSGDPSGLAPSCSNGDVYVHGWVKGQVTVAAANNVIITDSIRYVGSNSNPTAANLDTGIPTSNSSSLEPSSMSTDNNGTDILGLAAANFVEVYHPLSCSRYSCSNLSSGRSGGPYPLTNIQIDAAMVSVAHSFMVQDWDEGNALGILSVNGAIAQYFRGPVGTFNSRGTASGYDKNYWYDQRLVSLDPPYLADLVTANWGVNTYAEGAPGS